MRDLSSAQCTGTLTVPDGTLTLTVGGKPFSEGEDTNGAVVGGTGKYAGATGNFTSTESGGGATVDTLHIFVPEK